MKKIIAISIIAGMLFFQGACAYGEYVKFDIKYGMHEKVVNERYGEPLRAKYIKKNPIPNKKALYEIDESNYMILYYFSGRIHKIVLLEDIGLNEARDMFEED